MADRTADRVMPPIAGRPWYEMRPWDGSALLAMAAVELFALVIWADATIFGLGVLADETRPLATEPFLWRGLVLAISAIFLFVAVVWRSRGASGHRRADASWYEPYLPLVAMTVPLASVGIFLADPEWFYRLCLEDGVVETGSALLVFAASLVFAALAAHLAVRQQRVNKMMFVATAGLGVLCFVIGMEELSWLQRVFDLETPDAVRSLSERDELNVHNMATAVFEIAYYFGTFIFFIVVPLVHERTRLFDWAGSLTAFVPTRTVALAIAPAFSFNYVFWNVAFVQFSFWFTLWALVWYAWVEVQSRSLRAGASTLTVLGIFLLSQLVFFINGQNFVRLWDTTEYKELIIPVGMLAYALLTSTRVRAAALPCGSD